MTAQRIVLISHPAVPRDVARRIREAAQDLEVVLSPSIDDVLVERSEVVAGHLSPAQLGRAQLLRWNHLWTAGADADLTPGMLACDVCLTCSAGNEAVPLAEHALLLMMMLDREVPRWVSAQQDRRWDRYPHGELAGKTVAIVGLGHVGADLALKCAAFHMRVLGLRRSSDSPVPGVARVYRAEAIAEVASEADYLVVTAPLTDQTRGLVDARVLGAMKPTARIINVSRGEIVDSQALLDALRESRIAGAGLDAHDEEPLPADSPWWTAPNVVVTPHNGATTPQTPERGLEIFIDNLQRYASGEPLRNVVDKRSGYAQA